MIRQNYADDFFATFVSNDCMENFPSNTSALFYKICPKSTQIDPSYTYYMGLYAISYCGTFKPKEPKPLEAPKTATTETPPVRKFFTPSAADNIVSVIWNWNKGVENSEEFIASFITDANDKLGKGITVHVDYGLDDSDSPTIELIFTYKEAVGSLHVC
jgi:hypothetical protein